MSRRTLVVGTAWAVPAVVVASAAPALAASGFTVSFVGICIGPSSTLRIQLVISNPARVSGFLLINTLTVAGTAHSRIATVNLTGAAAPPPFLVGIPNPGLAAGASVAVSMGFSVVAGGTTTTGTTNATLTIFSQQQCPF